MDQDRQLGFALRDPFGWVELARIARQAESSGYRALFLPEISGRDALVTLGALAGETDGLSLGTGILPMGSRTPMLTAMGAATVQERSGGRLILGLGTGPAVSGALDRLCELVASLRRLFAGEDVEIAGVSDRLALDPGSAPPIWISALGSRAVRCAGRVADGVLLNWCTPERVARARVELAEGAETGGRNPAELEVGVYVRAALGSDEASVRRAMRAAAGEYASYPAYARQFASMGLGAEAEAAAAAHSARRNDDVPETLLKSVCLDGDPDQARKRLEEYRDAGADLPIVYPVAVSTPGAGEGGGAAAAGSVLATLDALAAG